MPECRGHLSCKDLHGLAVNDHLCFPQHDVSFHQFLSAGWVMLGLRRHSCLVGENEPDPAAAKAMPMREECRACRP